jgi:hypothetical protein
MSNEEVIEKLKAMRVLKKLFEIDALAGDE